MTSRLPASAAVLLLLAGLAPADGVSRQIDALEQAAADAETALAGDAASLRHARKVTKLLAKPSNKSSLAAELTSVAAAAKVAETKLADQSALLAAFSAASQGYTADLVATRANLVLATTSVSLPAKGRKRAQATLARFDRAFAPVLPGKAPTPRADLLRAEAASAQAGAGYTPYDAGATFDWVLASVALAAADDGVDLDGDGSPDNALATLQALIPSLDLGQAFEDALAEGGRFALIEMWYVTDLAKPDPFVLAGVLSATDGDADAGNDFSGTGVFAVEGAAVDAEGHPLVRTATSVAKNGRYSITLTGETLELAGVTLPPSAKVIVEGTATASSNAGLLGVAFPVGDLIDLLAAQGVPVSEDQEALLALFADLDLDPAEPGNDAISGSFVFTAAAATKTVAP
jgi:hypothetical protein